MPARVDKHLQEALSFQTTAQFYVYLGFLKTVCDIALMHQLYKHYSILQHPALTLFL